MALPQRAPRLALEMRRIRQRSLRRDTVTEEEVKGGPQKPSGECHERSVVGCAKGCGEVASDEDGPALSRATGDLAELLCGSGRGQSPTGMNSRGSRRQFHSWDVPNGNEERHVHRKSCPSETVPGPVLVMAKTRGPPNAL